MEAEAKAQAAVHAAQQADDRHGATGALLVLACVDPRLLGLFDKAVKHAQLSAGHFQQFGESSSESRSRATVAVAA